MQLASNMRFVSAQIISLLEGDLWMKSASHANDMARRLLDEGIYVIGFSFPVVARGQARIRVQLSAAHEPEHIARAVAAFTKVGQELGVLKGAAR